MNERRYIQMKRATLWEEAMGKLRAIDQTFYPQYGSDWDKRDYDKWKEFRERIEKERRDNEPFGC